MQKVPPARKSGNASMDLEIEMQRSALCDLLTLAHNYPDHLENVVRFYQARIDKGDVGNDDYFDEVSTIAKLDDNFIAAWIAGRSRLSAKGVAQCKAYDPESPRQLMTLALSTS